MTEIRSGDTLIVFAAEWITAELAQLMREDVLAALPGVAVVMVMSGITGVAVYRDGEQ